MSAPVIAIGLDAADPRLLESWIDSGHLPHLKNLKESGSYTRLNTYDWYRTETPWTTFLTGVSPKHTGYWSPIKYDSEEYKVRMIHAFDFEEFPPFYALAPQKSVTIFDMPQAPLVKNLHGEQVLAWGTHSGQTPSVSNPPELWQQIVDRHGSHPLLNNDGANCYSVADLQRLAEAMATGIERRANVCIDLIKNRKRDFFLTIFGEAHVAGHYFWHLGQPHPLQEHFEKQGAPNLLLSSFQAIDTAIGRIVEAAPQDATIVIFSAHGMGTNVMDLPSVVFLPEFMYRWNFPGRQAISPGRWKAPLNGMVPLEEMEDHYFAEALWRRTKEDSGIRTLFKRHLPYNVYKRVAPYLPDVPQDSPHVMDPITLRSKREAEPFQPSNWFRHFWPQMKAFALPSFSEGYIRINLKGRDKAGIVEPQDYEKVCDEISASLRELVDARTGEPMVTKIVRTRESPEDENPKSPDADLVVVWQENAATDTVESPLIGRIGPSPFLRTGSHRAGGFFLITGQNQQVALRDNGHAVDIAPTFLKLMGSQPSPKMEGQALF